MRNLSAESRQNVLAVVIGLIYGLLLRLGFAIKELHPILNIVSTSFLVFCPFSVGALAVIIGSKRKILSIGEQVGVAVSAIFVFLLGMFCTFLEGLICIVLVVPVFLAASIIGGLVAGFVISKLKHNKSTLPAFALLPVLVAPIESALPITDSVQSVSNTIYISATPEVVFKKLADVRSIKSDELGFTFVHLIGLPKPIEAEMNERGVGAVRTSRWEKNIEFQEVITQWKAPESIHYRFAIPKGGIPREALDEHVEIGGEYFDLIDGGYDLKKSSDGGVQLTLTTRFRNKSKLKLYGDIWGRMVLKDFHRSILHLMKGRSENDL